MGLDKFFGKKNKEEGVADSKVARILATGIALGAGGAGAAEAAPKDIFPEHHYHYQMPPDGKIPAEVRQQMTNDRLKDYGINPEDVLKAQRENSEKIQKEIENLKK